jgi:Fe-S-cluster containining protein
MRRIWKVSLRDVTDLVIEAPSSRGETIVEFPKTPMGLADLAAKAMEVSEALTRICEAQALPEGETVSCRKGCGACCRQPIPVTPAEAFRLARLVESFPEARRERTRRRFERALRTATEEIPEGAFFHSSEKYFGLGLPCPFLVRESCSIHPDRPSTCREQLVTSPAVHCASFPNSSIRILPMDAPIRETLEDLSAELLGSSPMMIPLISALAWVEENRAAGELRWEAGFLAARLVEGLCYGERKAQP